MPERPDPSSAPQKQSVKLTATVAVVGLFACVGSGLLVETAPVGDMARKWGAPAVA